MFDRPNPAQDCGKVILSRMRRREGRERRKTSGRHRTRPSSGLRLSKLFHDSTSLEPQEAPAFNNCEDERDNDLDQNRTVQIPPVLVVKQRITDGQRQRRLDRL